MQEERTTDLDHILSNMKPSNLDDYIDAYGHTHNNLNRFAEYLMEHNIPNAVIVRRCEGILSKSYIYDLINAKKQNPSRDVVLILCISMEMDRKMTRRMLENYGHRDLYPKDTRDIILATCINNRIYDLDTINAELDRYHVPLLNQL